jgi:hypothetical protein
MESSASAILEYTDNSFDLQKEMRSDVMEAHGHSSSSSLSRMRDCSPIPPNCGGMVKGGCKVGSFRGLEGGV